MALNDAFINAISLEGAPHQELEYVFYGKIADFKALEKASSYEDQEQWEVRIPKEENTPYFGCVRIRRTQRGDTTTHTLCMKALKEGKAAKDEVELKLVGEKGEEFFEQMRKLATTGMTKRRYFFPVEGRKDLTWEVDVYFKGRSKKNFHAWCKVDLEVPRLLRQSTAESFPLPFPIELTDVIYAQVKDRTEAQRDQINKLMDDVFTRSNPYGARDDAEEADAHD